MIMPKLLTSQEIESQSESSKKTDKSEMPRPSSTGSSQANSPDSSGASSPTHTQTSFVTNPLPRRLSLNLPQDVLDQMARRRASLEKLQVEKVTPWMQLYDFTGEEPFEGEENSKAAAPASP